MLVKAHQLAVQRGPGQADYRKGRVCRALGCPVEGGSLRIGIDQQDAAAAGQGRGDVKREGRLADPALLVQQRYDRHPLCEQGYQLRKNL